MTSPIRDELVQSAFRYRDTLIIYAFGRLRDWALAQDVVQDAFVTVMDKSEEFTPGTSTFLWVRQIVHFKVLETLRKRRREVSMVDEELQELVEHTFDDLLDERQIERHDRMREALQVCMAQLNATAVKVLAGFYAESKSCETLAAQLQRSVNAIRLLLSRARRQLHDCMVFRLQEMERA